MDKEIATQVNDKLQGLIGSFRNQLLKVRTERASPMLIDSVAIPCYGGARALKSIAQIVSEGSSTLLITPHDSSLSPSIEKALLNANLNIGVKRMPQILAVTVPPLTQERRLEIAKHLKSESESFAILMRNIRREGNDELKRGKKEKLLSEDGQKRCEKIIQKYLDDAINVLHEETKKKVEEILRM